MAADAAVVAAAAVVPDTARLVANLEVALRIAETFAGKTWERWSDEGHRIEKGARLVLCQQPPKKARRELSPFHVIIHHIHMRQSLSVLRW